MAILNKKVLIMILSLLLCIASVSSGAAKAEAMQPNIGAYQMFSKTAWSASYGLKTFSYRSDYLAQKSSNISYKNVTNHDWMAYKCTTDGLYSPEVGGNGSVRLYQIYMYSDRGNLLSPLSGSSFVNGAYYTRLICSGITFAGQISSATQSASSAENYQNRIETWFAIDSMWAPNFWTGDYSYTQNY